MAEVKIGMTIEEASEYTGIGRNTMRKLVEWERPAESPGSENCPDMIRGSHYGCPHWQSDRSPDIPTRKISVSQTSVFINGEQIFDWERQGINRESACTHACTLPAPEFWETDRCLHLCLHLWEVCCHLCLHL